MIRLPGSVEGRALRLLRNSEGSVLNSADALVIHQHRSKQQWVEFNDEMLDETPEGIELVERSEALSRVNKLFRNLEKDDQCALQMIVVDGMSLRQTAQLLGVSAMTVQRRVKRGLHTIAKKLNTAQPDA